MSNNLHFKVTVIVALLFSTLPGPLGAAETPKDQLLDMVPAQSLFCIRLNNLDSTLTTIDQFAMGISPIPMALTTLVRGQLATILGNPELKGVNTAGDFALFAALNEGETPGQQIITIAIPVTDYALFVSGNPNVGEPDANGVSVLAKQYPLAIAAKVNNYAVIKAPDAYKRLLQEARPMSQGGDGLAKTLDTAEVDNAAHSPVWLYANIQQVNKAFGPTVLGALEQTKKQVGQMGMARAMDIYVRAIETLMKETALVSVALRPRPDLLTLSWTTTAVSGTGMADVLSGETSARTDLSLLGYMQDGALANFAFRPNSPFIKKVNTGLLDFVAKLTPDITASDLDKLKATITDMLDALGNVGVLSMSVDSKTKPPFVMTYILQLTDVKKFDDVLTKSPELLETSGIRQFYKSLGLNIEYSMKTDVGSYKDVSIDSAKLILSSTEPNTPQGQMINALYGQGFEYRWATVDNLWVCAIGGDVDAGVRDLIDKAKSSTPPQVSPEIKAALDLLPGALKTDFLATYNYVRAITMLPALMPIPIPPVEAETSSAIAFDGKVGGGKAVLDVAIPKQQILEVVAAFMKMQGQMQQMQEPQPPQQIPTPNEPQNP